MILKDRKEAGKKLVEELKEFENTQSVIYALPRGGVVVGNEIARELNLPLSLVITRKIGHPLNPEYAICAIAEDGCFICDENEKKETNQKWLEEKFEEERNEARRRREVYLGSRAVLSPKDKIAIIVDDGVATGLTIKLAIKEIKHQHPSKIIIAVPVIPLETFNNIKNQVDKIIAFKIDRDFLGAVGNYYKNFPQIEDDEVIRIMTEYK